MYTVIGAFDDRQSAQRTLDTLVARGFPRDRVDLQAGPATPDPAASITSRGAASGSVEDGNDGLLARMRHSFASLFGSEEGEVGRYSEAIRRGGSVVVVDATDETQAERAAELMRALGGTIDLFERNEGKPTAGASATADASAAKEPPHDRGVTGGTAGAMALQALADEEHIVPTAASRDERDLGERRVGDRDRFIDSDALPGSDDQAAQERKAGDDWIDEDAEPVAGGPNPPTQPLEPGFGERLTGKANKGGIQQPAPRQ